MAGGRRSRAESGGENALAGRCSGVDSRPAENGLATLPLPGASAGWYRRRVRPSENPPNDEPSDWPYDENGVDRSLIRWMLSLSPTERLQAVQSSIELLASVRPLPDGLR